MTMIECPKTVYRQIHHQTTVALGARITPSLDSVQKELAGFPLHVRGMLITYVLSVTTVAASMPALMAGWKLWGALRVLFSMGTHRFIPELPGTALYHDSRRMFTHVPGLQKPGNLPDADSGPASITLQMYVPFALPQAPDGAERDGVIPVAALRDGDLVFQIGSGSDLNHTGVSYTVTSLTVDFLMEPLHQLRVPTAWGIRRADSAQKVLLLQPQGFLYYLDLFDPTVTTPLVDPNTYGRVQVTIGSGLLESNTIAELQRAYEIAAVEAVGLGDGSFGVSQTAPDAVSVIRPYWGGLITRQPRGAVKIDLPDKSVSQYAVQYRERGMRTDEFRRFVYGRLGVGPGVKSEVRASKKSAPSWLIPHLDEHVRWPGMPFAALQG